MFAHSSYCLVGPADGELNLSDAADSAVQPKVAANLN
jgi:hypothetical protein